MRYINVVTKSASETKKSVRRY